MITANKVVTLNVRVFEDEKLLASYENDKPLVYLHGKKHLVSGLENALEGKTLGDQFEVTLEPMDAYGETNADFIQTFPSSHLKNASHLKEGMICIAYTQNGHFPVTVKQIEDDIESDIVTIDANHPLAGRKLTFKVNVLAIRESSVAELNWQQC